MTENFSKPLLIFDLGESEQERMFIIAYEYVGVFVGIVGFPLRTFSMPNLYIDYFVEKSDIEAG